MNKIKICKELKKIAIMLYKYNLYEPAETKRTIYKMVAGLHNKIKGE